MVQSAILTELLGENYEGKLSKYKKTLGGRKVKLISELSSVYVVADLHSDVDCLKKSLDFYFKELMDEERPIYFVAAGDLFDPLTIKEDKSKDVFDCVIEMKRILGDSAIFLEGDHEHAYIAGPAIEKTVDGVRINQTKEFKKKLSEEEIDILFDFVKNMPLLVKTVNGYLISHSGPALNVKSIEEIDKISYNCDDYDNADEFLKTPYGSLIWGVVEYVKGGRKNYYFKEDMKNFLKALSSDGIEAKLSIQGHSGNAYIVTENAEYFGIDGREYLPDLNLLLLATAETQKTKYLLSFDVDAPFGEIYLGDLDKYNYDKTKFKWKTLKIKYENKISEKQTKKELSKKEKIEMIIKSENLDREDRFVEILEKTPDDKFDEKIDEYYKKGFFTGTKPY